jgi:hypothetical protein
MRFDYYPPLIQDLKSRVPAAFRRYDPDDGTAWIVMPAFAEVAVTLLLKYFPDTQVEFNREPWAVRDDAQADHLAALHLLPTAPSDLIVAAYRVLAKRHHPDAGGDPATMRRLTEAHDALRRRVGT